MGNFLVFVKSNSLSLFQDKDELDVRYVGRDERIGGPQSENGTSLVVNLPFDQ